MSPKKKKKNSVIYISLFYYLIFDGCEMTYWPYHIDLNVWKRVNHTFIVYTGIIGTSAETYSCFFTTLLLILMYNGRMNLSRGYILFSLFLAHLKHYYIYIRYAKLFLAMWLLHDLSSESNESVTEYFAFFSGLQIID